MRAQSAQQLVHIPILNCLPCVLQYTRLNRITKETERYLLDKEASGASASPQGGKH